MPGESTPLLSQAPPRGIYAPSKPSDLRGPCPLVNSLANHGYIARSGRNIQASELQTAVKAVGISTALSAFFARPIFNECQGPHDTKPKKSPTFLALVWAFLRNPWSILSSFGLRDPEQINKAGNQVLNLDQLAIPGIIEHDISLTRRDHSQKQGNCARHQDLVNDLLASSTDGGKTFTMEDLAALRKRRMQRQLDDNPALSYGKLQHTIACTEIALVLNVFGNGGAVPCSHMRALVQEERLPYDEGWKAKWWWTLGFVRLFGAVKQVKAAVGLDI